jgi:hypothetical protein
MKEIKLTNGGVALVDDEDFDDLNKHKWFSHKERNTAYAWRNEKKGFRQYGKVKMHRQILNPKKSEHVDHINGNGLDNRRDNIRVCTAQQNQMNRHNHSSHSSIYKGVSYHKQNDRWRALIHLNGKPISLGCYSTPEAAAIAYNEKAIELFGEFARPNVIKSL